MYFVDGYCGIRYRVDFSPNAPWKNQDMTACSVEYAVERIEYKMSKTQDGEEYSGVVFIPPSKERAEYLATSKFTVGKKEDSGLVSR